MWQVSCGGPSFRQQDFNQWRLQFNRSAPRRTRLQHWWERILSVLSFLQNLSIHCAHFTVSPPASICPQIPTCGVRWRPLCFALNLVPDTACWVWAAPSWPTPRSTSRVKTSEFTAQCWCSVGPTAPVPSTTTHLGAQWRFLEESDGSSEKFKDYLLFFLVFKQIEDDAVISKCVCLHSTFYLTIFLYMLFNYNLTT